MNEIDTRIGANCANPPIILQLQSPKPAMLIAPQVNKDDSFEKDKKDNPIMIDPNDKFVSSSDNVQPQCLVSEPMLGAKYNPKTVKKYGEEALKWGKRIWTGFEIYDTLDGYRERFKSNEAEA